MGGLPDPPPVMTATIPLTPKSILAERFTDMFGLSKSEKQCDSSLAASFL
jgi:hypothetical protein